MQLCKNPSTVNVNQMWNRKIFRPIHHTVRLSTVHKEMSFHLHVFYSHVTKAGKRLFKNGNYLIAFVWIAYHILSIFSCIKFQPRIGWILGTWNVNLNIRLIIFTNVWFSRRQMISWTLTSGGFHNCLVHYLFTLTKTEIKFSRKFILTKST